MSTKKLKKQLGLYDVFSISTGAMFSSGFFLLPGIAAAQTGESVYLAYLASGLLIIPAMLSVAELSTAMPRSGGAYYFLDRSLGPLVGTIGGLGSWVALVFKSSFALIGMSAYLSLYIDISFTMLALILTVLFGILNIFGAKETTLLQRLLVTTLIVILGVFLLQGLMAVPLFQASSTDATYQQFFRGDLHGFIGTVGLVFVSYAGLTKVTSVAEEVQNPDRNIPLAMILSLATAMLIYVVGVFIMVKVLPAEELYASLTPVVDAGSQFLSWLPGSLGVMAMVVAAVAAFASTGNAGIMSASRYPFAMARDKLLNPGFSSIGRTGTPTISISVTVGVMMIVLLVFDVEVVAKLASAFQLLLFGLLCVAVIVMRESRIDAYAPGFRSPFYPWTQIAGMLISVWLIAEMGLLPVLLTGVIIVLSVAWYYYYAGGKLKRQGAIYHIHERLGRNRYEGLEHELLSILNEKNVEKRLAYEQVVARSVILDIHQEHPQIQELIGQTANIFAGRTKIEKQQIAEDLKKRYRNQFTILGNGVAVSYLTYPQLAAPEMVIFRIKSGLDIEIPGLNSMTHAMIFLISPREELGLEMRLVGHLAEIVKASNFTNRWQQADSEKELRKILISDERFAHISVENNRFMHERRDHKISNIELTGDCLIAIIYRHGDLIIPHGNTELETDDELFIIGDPEYIRELTSYNEPRKLEEPDRIS